MMKLSLADGTEFEVSLIARSQGRSSVKITLPRMLTKAEEAEVARLIVEHCFHGRAQALPLVWSPDEGKRNAQALAFVTQTLEHN